MFMFHLAVNQTMMMNQHQQQQQQQQMHHPIAYIKMEPHTSTHAFPPPPVDQSKILPAASELLSNVQRHHGINQHAQTILLQQNGGAQYVQQQQQQQHVMHANGLSTTGGLNPRMDRVELANNLIATMFANPQQEMQTAQQMSNGGNMSTNVQQILTNNSTMSAINQHNDKSHGRKGLCYNNHIL
jgi:hypothetical protein